MQSIAYIVLHTIFVCNMLCNILCIMHYTLYASAGPDPHVPPDLRSEYADLSVL